MFPEYISEAPTILDTPATVKEEPYIETFPEAESKSAEDMILWSEGGIKTGKLIGSLNDIGTDEIKVVNELLENGKNVEIIPRSKVPGVNTPDFKVDGVVTELKTLENYNLNTPLKKIRKAFDKQGAEVVIYDVRKADLNATDVETIYSRLNGIYGGNVPGKIEFWTNDGIITK